MSVVFTPMQQKAIDARKQHLLISAGAGSGKTAVMTERIVSLILDGCDLKNMLIVTFTKAAANEMKRRIQKRLFELSTDKEAQPKTRLRARAQIETFSQANISTLHAFCMQVLRRHFHEVGIDPAFRTADEYHATLMRQESVCEALEIMYELADKDFLALSDGFGGKKTQLQDLILRTYQFMGSLSKPWEWMQQAIAAYGQASEDNLSETPAYQFFVGKARGDLLQAIKSIEKAIALLPEHGDFEKNRIQLQEELAGITNLFELLIQKNVQIEHFKVDFAMFRLTNKKTTPELPEREEIKALRQKAKDLTKAVQDQNWDTAKLCAAMNTQYPILKALYACLEKFESIYAQKKADKNWLDFMDLEQKTLQVLDQNLIAKSYQKRFEYIFIDEYQDSNLVQERIVEKLIRNDNLFCVGDSKQSIYRFRAADPSLFIDRAQNYRENRTGSVIPLNANFRSYENILHAVNDLFYQVMELSGEQSYTKDDALQPGKEKSEHTTPVKVILIDKHVEDSLEENDLEESSENAQMSDVQAEAQMISQYILSRVDKPIFDGKIGGMRKATFRDFVILLRNAKGVVEPISRVLSESGIPSYAELTGGYFQTIEVQVILSLLQLINNADRDLAWLAVMRAGIFGFEDQDLIDLRYKEKQGGIYACVHNYALDSGEALSKKCQRFLNFLRSGKQLSAFLHLEALLEWVLEQTQYFSLIAAMSARQQRMANLNAFLLKAKSFESSTNCGLYDFLLYVDGLLEAGQDMGEERIFGEGEDCVRLMSIHKSKGLEFPIVILAQTGKKINNRDATQDMIFHAKYGIGSRCYYAKTHSKSDTLFHRYLAARNKQETIAEELRILYVALTRAERELWIIGCNANVSKSISKWQQQTAQGGLLDFIMDGLMQLNCSAKLLEQTDNQAHRILDQAKASWEIQWHQKNQSQVQAESKAQDEKLAMLFGQAKSVKNNALKQKWNWAYQARNLPGKIAVSALGKSKIMLDASPQFLLGKRSTGIDKGIATHAVLEHIDWKRVSSKEQLQDQIARMVEQEKLSTEQANLVNINTLMRFFESELGKRMQNAQHIQTETPFTLQLPANDIFEVETNELATVQGMIDACFIENDCWILLDYKTDYVDRNDQNSIQVIAQKYRTQLNIYARALEQLTNKPVSQLQIVLLSAGEVVQVERNDNYEKMPVQLAAHLSEFELEYQEKEELFDQDMN